MDRQQTTIVTGSHWCPSDGCEETSSEQESEIEPMAPDRCTDVIDWGSKVFNVLNESIYRSEDVSRLLESGVKFCGRLLAWTFSIFARRSSDD